MQLLYAHEGHPPHILATIAALSVEEGKGRAGERTRARTSIRDSHTRRRSGRQPSATSQDSLHTLRPRPERSSKIVHLP